MMVSPSPPPYDDLYLYPQWPLMLLFPSSRSDYALRCQWPPVETFDEDEVSGGLEAHCLGFRV